VGILASVGSAWRHPMSKAIDVNDPNTVVIHRQIIQSKPILKQVYLDWYKDFVRAAKETESLGGAMLEIGCGHSFLEDLIPGIIKTDVELTPLAHRAMNAMKLDFSDGELRTIFMVHVLHHIYRPAKFFEEASRCLKPGGRLVMVEPSNNFSQRFLAKAMNHFEYFDDTVAEWENKDSERMTDANMALPYVIFIRDRERFNRQFPLPKVRRIYYHTALSYFVSGGLGYKSFLPSFCSPVVSAMETLCQPLMKKLGTTMTIEIERVNA
jgi:SAM-dependent methyltransferase